MNLRIPPASNASTFSWVPQYVRPRTLRAKQNGYLVLACSAGTGACSAGIPGISAGPGSGSYNPGSTGKAAARWKAWPDGCWAADPWRAGPALCLAAALWKAWPVGCWAAALWRAGHPSVWLPGHCLPGSSYLHPSGIHCHFGRYIHCWAYWQVLPRACCGLQWIPGCLSSGHSGSSRSF